MFVLFSIPAVVMATEYCVKSEDAANHAFRTDPFMEVIPGAWEDRVVENINGIVTRWNRIVPRGRRMHQVRESPHLYCLPKNKCKRHGDTGIAQKAFQNPNTVACGKFSLADGAGRAVTGTSFGEAVQTWQK